MGPVVFLHLRDDLRIGQLVRGLDSNITLRQRLGEAETLLELQLGLTRHEGTKRLGLPHPHDDLVVVPDKVLAVAFSDVCIDPAVRGDVWSRIMCPHSLP